MRNATISLAKVRDVKVTYNKKVDCDSYKSSLFNVYLQLQATIMVRILCILIILSMGYIAVEATRNKNNYKFYNGNTLMKIKNLQEQIVNHIIPSILLYLSVYPLSIRESSTKGIRNIFTTSSLAVDQSSKASPNSSYRNELLNGFWHSLFSGNYRKSSLTRDTFIVDNNHEISRNCSDYTTTNIKIKSVILQ